jgi:flagellar protein FlaG
MEIRRSLPVHSFQQAKPAVLDENVIKHNKQADQIGPAKNDDVVKNLETVNKFLSSTNSHLKFTLHEELNEYYVAIVDERTKEVIKEIPPKKLLDMFAAMKETIGIFIDKKI